MNARRNLIVLPGSLIGWFSAGYFTGDMSVWGACASYGILIAGMSVFDLIRGNDD